MDFSLTVKTIFEGSWIFVFAIHILLFMVLCYNSYYHLILLLFEFTYRLNFCFSIQYGQYLALYFTHFTHYFIFYFFQFAILFPCSSQIEVLSLIIFLLLSSFALFLSKALLFQTNQTYHTFHAIFISRAMTLISDLVHQD